MKTTTTTRSRPAPPPQNGSDEARLGASLAFGKNAAGKPALKPKPGGSTAAAAAPASVGNGGGDGGVGGGERDNGALAAALSSTAGTGRGKEKEKGAETQNAGAGRGRGRGRGLGVGVGKGGLDGGGGEGRGGGLWKQNTGSSVGATSESRTPMRPRLDQGLSSPGTGYLQPSAADQSRSPSFIAATLAASRSASLSPNPTGGAVRQVANSGHALADARIPTRHTSRSPSVRSAESVKSSRGSEEMILDTTSIPPTGRLIGMFEQNSGRAGKDPEGAKGEKRPKTPVTIKQAASRDITSPAPVRPRTPSPLAHKPKKALPEPKSPNPTVVKEKAQAVPPILSPRPNVVPSKAQSSLAVEPLTPDKIPPAVQARKASLQHTKPIPIPAKPPKLYPPPDSSGSGSSTDSFVSASDHQEHEPIQEQDYKPSWRAELNDQNHRRRTESVNTATSAATINSLADAIVASSLASSRAGSPSKMLQSQPSGLGLGLYPPLPPPRRTKHHHHHHGTHLFHNGKTDVSRTPSPGKNGNGGGGAVLRTTMRKVKSKESIDEGEKRRGRKNLVKKHPNKHHEGDRKRWRDSITERERKRYEAVWASNRGLHTGVGPGVENEVCSLVVRDVFSRSRLSEDVLEEVYALVDRRGAGTLGKEEFVVGLWLVDQRLKGRKLPIRVSESVWKSVGILGGIKVKGVK